MQQYPDKETLIKELRRYIDLRMRHVRLAIVEKITFILAMTAFASLAMLLIGFAICYFSNSFVLLLQFYVNSVCANALVAVALIAVVILIYWQRKRWLLDPISRIITRTMIDNEEEP